MRTRHSWLCFLFYFIGFGSLPAATFNVSEVHCGNAKKLELDHLWNAYRILPATDQGPLPDMETNQMWSQAGFPTTGRVLYKTENTRRCMDQPDTVLEIALYWSSSTQRISVSDMDG
jgi:hypothetical protein